ncbi:MAG TPA: hypothetical protein VGM87_10340 [Roseomonas sp.]|jgi:hypothetical protein
MFRNPFALILIVLLGLLAVGALVIGAFPPTADPRPVERVLPNDRFQTR